MLHNIRKGRRGPCARPAGGAVAVAVLALSAVSAPRAAHAVELLTNGGFENALTGWTATSISGSVGSFITAAVDATVPAGNPFAIDTPANTLTPGGGTTFALSAPIPNTTSGLPGDASLALYQTFTVPTGGIQSARFNFQYFGLDYYGNGAQIQPSLDYRYVDPENPLRANLHARVDLLRASVLTNPVDSARGIFSVDSQDVVRNFFDGVDTVGGTVDGYNQAATGAGFDITSVLTPGTTYVLRIAAVNNQGELLYFGVDNFTLDVVPIVTSVPEAGSGALLLGPAGLAAAGVVARRRRPRRAV